MYKNSQNGDFVDSAQTYIYWLLVITSKMFLYSLIPKNDIFQNFCFDFDSNLNEMSFKKKLNSLLELLMKVILT